jgi:translation elongation factor EF-G
MQNKQQQHHHHHHHHQEGIGTMLDSHQYCLIWLDVLVAAAPPPPRLSPIPAGTQLNLLDTPGHQDFSEDTYRCGVWAC